MSAMRRVVFGIKQKFGVLKSLSVYFNKSEKMRFFLVIVSQIFLGLLDLLGVAVIGLIGTVTLNTIQGRPLGALITKSLELIGIREWTLQLQISVMGLLAVLVLVLRTALSIYFQRKILVYLSNKGAKLAELVTSSLMQYSILKLQKIGFALPVFAITTGSSVLTVTVIGGITSLFSDAILILVLLLGMTFFNPVLAAQALFFYVLLALALYLSVQRRVRKLGMTESHLSIEVNKRVFESLTMYRELFVHGRREFYAEKITKLRNALSAIQARSALIPNISKYVFESAVVIGSLLLCAIQFLAFDAIHALTSLIFFLAVSSRIAPAVLRLHQNALQVKTGLGLGSTTLELLNLLHSEKLQSCFISKGSFLENTFSPRVELSQVSFSHEGNFVWSLDDISFVIEPGEFFAIAGPSAAGKTTLVDLVLGLIEPSAGTVKISNLSPSLAIDCWPGLISYVPQETNLIEGTLLDNIALGYETPDVGSERIKDAITAAGLLEYINSLPKGVLSEVQERGMNLSGGLRQRLGIARALFTNPQLIVFDEATSALDSETERVIIETIRNLRGSKTIILIAHRLSTILEADRVLYLSDGKVKGIGRFSEVRTAVLEFDEQAKLMGL
jgi:ABC-type multidrug transport system fused ATPase/permease subunit